jgi:hypothetical protein
MPRSYVLLRAFALLIPLVIVGLLVIVGPSTFGGWINHLSFGGNGRESAVIIKAGLFGLVVVVIGGIAVLRRVLGR